MKDSYSIGSRLLERFHWAVSGRSNQNSRISRSRNFADEIKDLEDGPSGDKTRAFCKSTFSLGLTGLVAIAVGMLIMFIRPYDLIFRMKVLFSEGGEVFEMWRSPPVDIYLRVHLFNVTNAEAFMAGKEKLKVQEVGPYVYKEAMFHANVTFNDNGTLSAVPQHPLEWVPELSKGDHEKDQLILPHIALLSIADVVAQKSFFTRAALNFLIKQTNSKPLMKMSPKEFMFGYESTLMTLGYKFLPSWIDFHKLGLIDRMYNFKGDYETVYTGENDITRAGLLETYRGSTHLPQWDGYCGNIQNASDGTKFPTHINKNDTLFFFRKSLCRAKPMVWVNATTSCGLKGYVYKFVKNANDNGKYTEKNKCFCKTKKCLPPGVIDVHECYYGFPIALSYPHFYEADASVGAAVDGLVPDKREHESYFVIQPESGLPLDLAVRYQINMALGDISNIEGGERFSNLIVPMLWTENRLYSLPENLAWKFNLYLNVLPLFVSASMYFLFVLGVIFTFMSLRKFSKSSRRPSFNVSWINEEDSAAAAERKLSAYLPTESRRMSSKEMDLYFSSLVTPLNQQLHPVDMNA